MSTANFKLDMFEGPLDLLLHLINKHKLNIYDIEIAVLLEQYLEYMAGLEEEDYEDAADFLEMAARLIYIKTVSLLPKDDEGEELKKELQGSLIEYSLCKMAAAKLKEQYAGGDIFVREPVKLPVNKTFTGERDPMELAEAYLGMSEKARHSKPLKAEMFKPILSRRIVSVTSKIIHVLKMLITHGECFLDSMYNGCADKSERVAVFLAVLELTKSGRIFLNDDNTRVYMNSASKKRKISSSFDEAELAAEEAAAEAAAELEKVGETAEIGINEDSNGEISCDSTDNGSTADSDIPSSVAQHDTFSETSYDPYENTPPPYKLYERPARTVYKSETKQRGTFPVLRIELAPELQKLIDEGRQASEEIAAAEVIPAEGTVTVNAEETAAAEVVPAENTATVNATETAAAEVVPAEDATTINAAETAAAEVVPAESATTVNAEETAAAEVVPAESSTTVNAEAIGCENEPSAYITADDPAEQDYSSSHFRPNLFALRFYWGKTGWAAARLKL